MISPQEIAYKSVDARKLHRRYVNCLTSSCSRALISHSLGSYYNNILLECDNSSRAIARIPSSVIGNAHLSRPAESPLWISFAKSSISIIPQKYLPGTHLRCPTLSRSGISPNPNPPVHIKGEQTGHAMSACSFIRPSRSGACTSRRMSAPSYRIDHYIWATKKTSFQVHRTIELDP